MPPAIRKNLLHASDLTFFHWAAMPLASRRELVSFQAIYVRRKRRHFPLTINAL
jgi:hypothetical protein